MSLEALLWVQGSTEEYIYICFVEARMTSTPKILPRPPGREESPHREQLTVKIQKGRGCSFTPASQGKILVKTLPDQKASFNP